MSREISGHTYTDIQSLWQWCAELETRQRAYGMHDPDCMSFRSQQAQQRTGAYVVPRDCTCWLRKVE